MEEKINNSFKHRAQKYTSPRDCASQLQGRRTGKPQKCPRLLRSHHKEEVFLWHPTPPSSSGKSLLPASHRYSLLTVRMQQAGARH